MMTLEGYSRESKQAAVAQALTAANIEKAGEDERVDVSIVGLWEDGDGYHARISVQYTPLPGRSQNNSPQADGDEQEDLNDAIANEAEELLALFVPDAAHEYRKEDEQTETMKEEPRFAEMQEKMERDFDKAEHPDDQNPAPAQNPKATHPEPHIEGTAEEEDR